MSLAESFAAIVGLASSFSTGRDVKTNTELLEFQNWLIEQNHQDYVDEINRSRTTLVYVKALLNKKLPLIIQVLKEISGSQEHLPNTIQSLIDIQSETLIKAVGKIEKQLNESLGAKNAVKNYNDNSVDMSGSTFQGDINFNRH